MSANVLKEIVPDIGSLLLDDAIHSVQPDPQRTVDYQVIVGTNYNSCAGDVLEVGEE